MGTLASRTTALVLSFCTTVWISPVTAQAYSCRDTSGTLTVSYESKIVVPKGENAELSVKAETSDGQPAYYRWSELTETDQTDENGYTLWSVAGIKGARESTYSAQNIREYKSYECEIWCEDGSYETAFEDVYPADALKLNRQLTCTKTREKAEEKFFLFTPSESGIYVFLSSGRAEAQLNVYDQLTINTSSLIAESEEYYNAQYGKNGGRVIAELTAGHTYAVQAYFGDSECGSYSVLVQKYVQTNLALSSEQTSLNVDKKSASTTMKASAAVTGKAKASDTVTYQWYQYDPLQWDYVPIEGADQSSYTVKNSSLQWRENNFRCDATDQYGESDVLFFTLYHTTDWYASATGYDERVSYGAKASLHVQAGLMNEIYDADGEWVSEEFVEDDAGKTYQWYRIAEDGASAVKIADATAASYTTGKVTADERYLCVVQDADGICDYRQYDVRPVLMDVAVDRTYYSLSEGESATVKITADAKYKKTTLEYYWYEGFPETDADSGSVYMDYTAIENWDGRSSVKLSNITETQYLKCEVCASTEKNGVSLTDYVEINFVLDPGTGYYAMYTTADDKNVTGASQKASSETTINEDGSYTTVSVEPDGSTTSSVTEENDDGSVTTTVKVRNADGSTSDTEFVLNPDASTIEYTTDRASDGKETRTLVLTSADGTATSQVSTDETNSAGKKVAVTVTTETSATGKVLKTTEQSVIKKPADNTTATVTVQKNAKGKVTSATAAVKMVSESGRATLGASLLAQIEEAAGADAGSVEITLKVTDENGKTRYKVLVSTGDLTPKNTLYLYKYTEKSGTCHAVNSKTYKVSAKGAVTVTASEKATYRLLTKQEAKAATKQLKATYAAKKTSVTLKIQKTATFALKKGADRTSIRSIAYTSSNPKVAAVTKSGKITAKAKGTATVSAKITLKNGATKTLRMKVTVR